MKTRSFLGLFLLTAMTITSFSCKKDVLAENQKNIEKAWSLQSYYVNGVDKTSTLTISNYKESYTNPETYVRTYTDKNGSPVTQTGAYKFEDAQKVSISGVGSVEYSATVGSASSSYYTILKLNATEYWYSFTNSADTHEFHFTRN